MKTRLFLTSMLAVMTAGPAFAAWPTGVGTVGVNTNNEVQTTSSTLSGYIGSGENTANCQDTPLTFRNTTPGAGTFTLTAQWDADICSVNLDVNTANGGVALSGNNSTYNTFYTVYDDGAYKTRSNNNFPTNKMTDSANGFDTLPTGQTVTATWNANTVTNQTATLSSTSDSDTRPFEGFFQSATGASTNPMFSWNSTSSKMFITTAGINKAKTIAETGGSCPTTTWYAHWGCATLARPTAESTGYTFDGWYDAATGGTKQTADPCLKSDKTYYAHWTANTYTVTYRSGTCKSTNDAVVYTHTGGATYNQNYSVPAAANTAFGSAKTGYAFDGWNTSSGQTETNFPGNSETPWLRDDGLSVYAVCHAKSYTITYNCGDGSFKTGIPAWTASTPANSDKVTYDSPYAFSRTPGDTCQWANHNARPAWKCVKTGTSTEVLTTWPSANSDWEIDSNVTCTAEWNDIVHLVWNPANNGATTENTCEFSTTNSITVPAAPTKTGYKFKGWLITNHSATIQ